MALVYSYIRFSTKKQMDGDSFRRQVEQSDKWIADNGHSPASLTLHDLGVSAFKGRNKDTGALGLFLEAIKEGRVKPGSILLLEALDRLSRQGVDEAYDLFRGILKTGVLIVVLMPYEITYTSNSLKSITELLIPLIAFYLANLESENKSKRISAAWKAKRDRADGKPIVDPGNWTIG